MEEIQETIRKFQKELNSGTSALVLLSVMGRAESPMYGYQIAKFIEKRGQGIHHISFEVDDVQSELDRLKGDGIKLINEKPYLNAHKDLVAFIHPKSTFGVLIELIQKKEE